MRTIDRILDFINEMEGLSPAEREVLRARIEPTPTPAELNEARLRLAPVGSINGWRNVIRPEPFTRASDADQ